jgi:hypothetical protein
LWLLILAATCGRNRGGEFAKYASSGARRLGSGDGRCGGGFRPARLGWVSTGTGGGISAGGGDEGGGAWAGGRGVAMRDWSRSLWAHHAWRSLGKMKELIDEKSSVDLKVFDNFHDFIAKDTKLN